MTVSSVARDVTVADDAGVAAPHLNAAQFRISRLTELVDIVVDHPGHYEPWALELRYVAYVVLVSIGFVAFPYYFIVARRLVREGNVKRAKQLRGVASVNVLSYCILIASFLAR